MSGCFFLKHGVHSTNTVTQHTRSQR